MDRKLGGLILLLAAFPVAATDVHKLSNYELCTDYAVAIITGQPAHTGFMQSLSEDQIGAELLTRDEHCRPDDVYEQAALHRLAQQEDDRRERRHRIADAIQAANQVMNPPKAPVTTTTCHTFAGTTTCTSQ